MVGKWIPVSVVAGLAAIGIAGVAGSGASANPSEIQPSTSATQPSGPRTADCVRRIRVHVGQPGRNNRFAGGSTNTGQAGQVRIGGRLVTPPPGRSTVAVVRVPCATPSSTPTGRPRGN
ncbi:hypothetical protein GCM10009539_23360 [Cryptosporangium japonicum]|uniref:Secreted protein n=1 Tax=Cryptosporangium japonicum TaxID=80872 RepID=A0ABN0U420_9ACTN